jgi:hypothetical protein
MKVGGYIVEFNKVTLDGYLFTSESLDRSKFDNLIKNGDIVEYTVKDDGIEIVMEYEQKRR